MRKSISDLYGLRSRIVHSGKTVVSGTDLALLRGYCRLAIFRMLNDPTFREITSNDDIEEWFEQQILGVATLSSED